MERVMSVEEKIRRAEEIYERKRQGENRTVAKVTVNNDKKDIKLLRKMIIQILVCTVVYFVIYNIKNNQYVFSEEFINKINEIISYDTNFMEIYSNIENSLKQLMQNNEEMNPEESIGGAEGEIIGSQEETIKDSEDNSQDRNNSINENEELLTKEQNDNEEKNMEQLSQEEQDIIAIKKTTSFIKPIEGIISSKFGRRETATGSVPKNHTGTDIAANLGTKIKSATDGEVVLSSTEGDYRKTFKNSNR